MLEEIRLIKSDEKTLREFGLTIGAILVILGDAALWRARPAYPYLLGAGFLLMGLGQVSPRILKPLQKAWMALSIVIGFFMSRFILAVLFYSVMTPIGLVMRILGKDILDQRIDGKRASYWIDRTEEKKEKAGYERQY